MRVAHVLYSGLGGHSAVLFSLLEAEFLKKDTNYIIFAGVEEPPIENLINCRKLKIDYIFIRKSPGKNYFGFLYQILKKLVNLKIDNLFIHGLSVILIIPIFKLMYFKKKTFVLVRDTQANKLKSSKEWILLALSNIFADKIVYLTKEATILPSQKLLWFYQKEKVNIIGNGLNLEFYSPLNTERTSKNIINIGMQSRMQTNKDHVTLIKSFDLLCKHSPSQNFHLHLAGEGETRNSIEELVNRFDLSSKVTFYGILNNEEILYFLRKLDIYIHCTHGETMSTAIMQALSCGLPVIASDVDGVNNMIYTNIGLLYEPQNFHNLTNKIEWLIENNNELINLGIRGREFAIKNFAINDKVKAYENLFYNS
jgi:glycosyltransferase involved in cell wall biosynthesis